MNVQILSEKLIIPHTPTPPNLHNYKISATDELAPTMNVPLIFYYQSPNANIFNHLKNSLAQTLTQFYPLAGRYKKESHSVDCNDQGVKYVEAQVKFKLSEIISQGPKIKPELLNNFIPCEIGAVDEDSDPLLAIQVTTFDCGGLAVGLCVSHRIADASTLGNFVNAWAAKSKGNRAYENHYPIFQSASYFPGRNLDGTDVGIPRNIINGRLEAHTKMFFFSTTAISVLREKAGGRHSKVQLVFALIWSALMGVDKVKKGRQRASVILQAVNLREKTIPPIPKHSCGNFWGLAMPRSETGDFQTLVTLLSGSVRKTAKEFGRVLCDGDEGQMVVIEPLKEVSEILGDDEVSTYWFSSWSKFPFYEADFGWGKPVWVSSVNLRVKNAVFLMDEREGDGIEAWVHLDKNAMLDFQQDADIRAYT
ncbi:hypothetical protein LguiB_006895 [Lonicera macranthoides]